MTKEQEFIKEQVDKYYKLLDDCDNDNKDFDILITLLVKHYPNIESYYEGLIDSIKNNIQTSKNLKKIAKEQIKMLQENCEHDMVYCGNDSHYDYEKCEYCGLREKT